VTIDDDAPLDEVRMLLREYVAGLPVPVEIPDFDAELADLPGPYARPRGRLLVARTDGTPAGCVALRSFRGEAGEPSVRATSSRPRGPA